MLSAVESFGSASAAAAHPYAHHNPFAIAAAAAAAGSAAAAAAAVIPSHHHHHHHHHHLNHSHHQSIKSVSTTALEHQFALNHSYNSVNGSNNHISNPHLGGGLFLPPPTLSLTTSSAAKTLSSPLVPSSKCSPQEQPKSPRDRSPRSKPANFQGQESSCPSNMSSAEFARPHPKQPRYNINNNNVNTTNNNNHLNNNNNYTSNAIPLHMRSTKVVANINKNYNNCLNNNNNTVAVADKTHCNISSSHLSPSNSLNKNNNTNIVNKTTLVAQPRAKYSNEQSGPVNLVTNNNANSANTNNSNNCRTPPTSLSSDVSASSSIQDESDSNRKQEMFAQKLSFSAQSLAVSNNAAVAAAAAAYQYNYPHIYASRALYGSSALFSGHHPLGHTLRPCPTYLGSQHEAFSPYLQAAGVYQTGVPPNVQSQQNAGLLRTASQVLLNNNGLGIGSKPSSPLERVCAYAQSNPKEITNMNGTYLNGKVNTSPAAPESVSGFKVPSGKEGSLKHRILTRPSASDKDGCKRRSPISASILRSNSNNSTSNFTKGAYIELANGVLRRVEDMRTEDFIQSAEKSAIHQLAESTVVRISATQSSVIITFSYDKNRSKADVEVSQEHPFFVYGQGWASCNPELTLKTFGLKCQRLQVGDICISLTSREHHYPPQNSVNNINNHQISVAPACGQSVPSQNFDKSESTSLPQNLSRKLPPTAENTTMALNANNQLAASMGAPTYVPNNHHTYDEAASFENQISRHHEFYQPQLHLHHPYHRLLGHSEGNHPSSSRIPLPPPPQPPQSHSASVQQSRYPSNGSPYYSEAHHPPSSETQQQPVDASLSRKRRWSAPESICDDDENECQPPSATRLSNTDAYNS